MRKLNVFACMLLLLTSTIFAQVGIGTTTPAASSALDIRATNKGLLIPSVALTGSTDTVTITSPATSLFVYNNATAGTSPNNVTPGYYYYNGSRWERLTNSGANSIGAFTSANANGATITGGVLQLAPASGSTGGVVTSVAQTFGGIKTFSSPITSTVATGTAPFTVTSTTPVPNLSIGGNAATATTATNATNSAITNDVASNAVVYPVWVTANGGNLPLKVSDTKFSFNPSTGRITASGDATINGLTIGKGNGNNDTNTALGNGSLAVVTPNLPTALDGINNTAVGRSALAANTSGNGNIAVGSSALTANTSGLFNIAIGVDALRTYNVLGGGHIAIGYQALSNSRAGYENTAVGNQSQLSNIGTADNTGVQNTSVGAQSLKANVSGKMNTAIGANAANGTIGDYNTAIGGESLKNNPDQFIYNNNTAIGYNAANSATGSLNTAIGAESLKTSTGNNNVAIGYNAANITSGSLNTAIGAESLKASGGANNVAIGYQALSVSADGSANNGSNNTIIGYQAQLNTNATATAWEGSNNTVIGAGARVNNAFSNSTAIGSGAIATASNTIQLGNGSITDVYFGASGNYTVATSPAITAGGTGGANARAKGFYTNSDARIKKDIVNSKYGLATILKLRPVDYHLINDVKQEPQVGFIAQEVKALVPELVTGKEGDLAKGEILGVNYAGLAPILTKAIQELKKENELQQIEINQLKELVKNLINKK